MTYCKEVFPLNSWLSAGSGHSILPVCPDYLLIQSASRVMPSDFILCRPDLILAVMFPLPSCMIWVKYCHAIGSQFYGNADNYINRCNVKEKPEGLRSQWYLEGVVGL